MGGFGIYLECIDPVELSRDREWTLREKEKSRVSPQIFSLNKGEWWYHSLRWERFQGGDGIFFAERTVYSFLIVLILRYSFRHQMKDTEKVSV